MGVLSDGSPYLTSGGLARMCGVDIMSLLRLSNNWAEEQLKPRGAKIKELLAAQGYRADTLYLRFVYKGKETFAFTDAVCMAVLEYYAFESSQGANPTALKNYRLLARHSFRAFIYNRCGYDPNKHIPESWRNFHARVLLNDQIPANYFSVFREVADLVVHLIQSECPVDDRTVPDISVGQMWGKHWTEAELESQHGPRLKHPHNYPGWFPQSKANPVDAWIYPAKALGDFRVWLYGTYVKTNFASYVAGKVKNGIFLPSRAEILLEIVNQKGIVEEPDASALPPPI